MGETRIQGHSPVVRAWLLSLLVASFAFHADADAVFTPAEPTSNDVITATIGIVAVCDVETETVLLGSTVRTAVHFTGCLPFPPVPNTTVAEFGPLPAGTYRYEVYFRFGNEPAELQSEQPLVVAASPDIAAVPTVDELGRMLMIVLAAVAGVAAIRAR